MSRQVSRSCRIALAFFLLALFLSTCADMFQQKIPFPGGNDSLDNIFREVDVITKLSRPERLYVAPYYSDSQLRLTWEAVPSAAYYKIECAAVPVSGSESSWTLPDEGDYEIINDYCVSTSFIHEVLRTPTLDRPEYRNRYFYRVSAFNTVAKIEESDPTEPQSAMLFRSPTGLTATGGTSEQYVDLRWDSTMGAVSYEVWRSESFNGSPARQLGTVLGNNNWFRDWVSVSEQGKDFYYMVTAKNGFGNDSLQTRPAYGYAKMAGAPNAPTNVRLDTHSGRGDSTYEIRIRWEPVDEPDAYYVVYRYSSVDSSLTKLSGEVGTTNAFFSDTQQLRPGVYYYYKVQAIVEDNGKVLKSEFSSPDPEGFILSPPETVLAEKSQDGTVTVKWLPAMGSENERQQYLYHVYADTSNTGSFSTPVADGISPVSNTDAEGYICAEGLPANYTFFKVTTVKGSVESGRSITVSPAPAAAIIIDASQHAFIEGTVPNSSGVYPVKITWKKPEGENPAFYHIQRSIRTGDGFSRINDAVLSADGTGSNVFSYDPATGIYTYIDRNDTARVARKYYYRVLSLNLLGQGRFPSAEKIGWGALTHTQFLIEHHKTIISGQRRLTLMWKPGSTDKVGNETKNGGISGTYYYNAQIQGAGARIIIEIKNYCDFYIENDPEKGPYFILNGNTNTTADLNSNGKMDGVVTDTGMYAGWVKYDNVIIKGGSAGGGYYDVQPDGFPIVQVPYSVLY
jgi:hypothetical protein